mgnify:CR=1 FL=1
MVIVLEKGIPQQEKDGLKDFLSRNNFKVNEINGDEETIEAVKKGEKSISAADKEINQKKLLEQSEQLNLQKIFLSV